MSYSYQSLKPLRQKSQSQYDPEQQQIRQYAQYIGIELPEEEYMYELAIEGVKAQLPPHWQACQTPDGQIVYRNRKTRVVQEQHPMDEEYRRRVVQLRAQYQNYMQEHGNGDEGELNTIPEEKSQHSNQLEPDLSQPCQSKQLSVQTNKYLHNSATMPLPDSQNDNQLDMDMDEIMPSRQFLGGHKNATNTLKEEKISILGVVDRQDGLNKGKIGVSFDTYGKPNVDEININNKKSSISYASANVKAQSINIPQEISKKIKKQATNSESSIKLQQQLLNLKKQQKLAKQLLEQLTKSNEEKMEVLRKKLRRRKGGVKVVNQKEKIDRKEKNRQDDIDSQLLNLKFQMPKIGVGLNKNTQLNTSLNKVKTSRY